jgi:hypothetical protein
MLRSKPITTEEIAALGKRVREIYLPRLTADTARLKLREVQGARPRRYKQFVDGVEGAPLGSVRPGGNIRFLFGALTGVLQWIYQELRARSPVGPERGEAGGQHKIPGRIGEVTTQHVHYRDVHWLFVDGARDRVPATGETVVVNEVAFFVNARPYARRLEHGWSLQAPDGVYELVALEAERRFPDARIEFRYLREGEIPQPIPWRAKPWYGYPSISVRQK